MRHRQFDFEYLQPPPVSRQLVEYLQHVFPNRLPEDLTITDRELGARVGEQRVIQWLLARIEEQEEALLDDVS